MELITQIPAAMGLAAVLLILIGLAFLVTACIRLRRLRLLAAGGHGLFSIALLALGLALAATGFNLHTYQRLTDEREVAEIEFSQLGPQFFSARIHYPDSGRYEQIELQGDAWQMDARVLKWEGPAVFAGLDSGYRLERISGRYEDVDAERSRPRSVHQLSDNPGLDLWALTRRHERWLPWVDARYGSATYVPMRDGAAYRVSISQTGLVARAVNTSAREAIDNWY